MRRLAGSCESSRISGFASATDDSTAGRPGKRSGGDARDPHGPPDDAARALEVFRRDVLQEAVVEREVGDNLLEPAILVLDRPQPLGLGDCQAWRST